MNIANLWQKYKPALQRLQEYKTNLLDLQQSNLSYAQLYMDIMTRYSEVHAFKRMNPDFVYDPQATDDLTMEFKSIFYNENGVDKLYLKHGLCDEQGHYLADTRVELCAFCGQFTDENIGNSASLVYYRDHHGAHHNIGIKFSDSIYTTPLLTAEDPGDLLDMNLMDFSDQAGLTGIGRSIKDTNSILGFATSLITSFQNNDLSIGSIRTYASEYFAVSASKLNEIVEVFADTLKTVNGSPDGFMIMMKEVLSKLAGMSAQDEFTVTFGVDTYRTDTHFFLGFEQIASIASAAVSLVLSIIKPVVGAVAAVVSTAVSGIIKAGEINESNTCVFPDNADFPGYGQNIVRSRIFSTVDDYQILTVQGNAAMICETPITTAIIINNPKKDSLNRDVFPYQEFLKPIIPTSYKGWNKLFYALSGIPTPLTCFDQLRVDLDIGGEGHAYSYNEYAIGVTGNWTLHDGSIHDAALEVLSTIEPDSQDFHWCGSSDSDDLIRLGVMIAYLLWWAAIDPTKLLCGHSSVTLTDTGFYWAVNGYDPVYYGSRTFNSNQNLKGIGFKLDPLKPTNYSQSQANEFYTSLLGMIAWMGLKSGSADDYSALTNVPVDEYVYNLARKGVSVSGAVVSNVIDNLSDWTRDRAYIDNEMLVRHLSYGALGHWIMSNPAAPIVPNYSAYAWEPSAFTPSIVPPKESVNIWARALLTIGTIAAVVVTAAIVKKKLAIKLRPTWNRINNETLDNWKAWQASGDKKDYKAYKWSQIKSDFLGTVFGYGSYDAANAWVNYPASTVSGLASELAGSGSDATISEVVQLIKG